MCRCDCALGPDCAINQLSRVITFRPLCLLYHCVCVCLCCRSNGHRFRRTRTWSTLWPTAVSSSISSPRRNTDTNTTQRCTGTVQLANRFFGASIPLGSLRLMCHTQKRLHYDDSAAFPLDWSLYASDFCVISGQCSHPSPNPPSVAFE